MISKGQEGDPTFGDEGVDERLVGVVGVVVLCCNSQSDSSTSLHLSPPFSTSWGMYLRSNLHTLGLCLVSRRTIAIKTTTGAKNVPDTGVSCCRKKPSQALRTAEEKEEA